MTDILQPDFKSTRIAKDQTTKDILKGVVIAIKEKPELTAELAKRFYDKDPVKSCEKVWHFLKKNLKYEREEKDDQTSKNLARLLYDKYGDCKHYTIFSYAILDKLGIPVAMRLVSQKILNKEPTHIYTYALINGKEYIVDPVMNDFNQECNYNYKCDLTLNKAMSMTHLSGVQNSELGRKKLFSKAKSKLSDAEKKRKAVFTATKKKHDEFLKKQGKKVQTGIKKRFANIKKDVAVKHFLKAVSGNYLNLAKRIEDVYKTHPEDLKKFWANYGSWQDLAGAVNKGSKSGRYMSGEEGSEAEQYEEGAKQSMGIIMQIIEFFKKRKAEKNKKQDAEDQTALQTMEQNIMSDNTIPKVDENGNPSDKVDNAQTSTPGESDSTKPMIDFEDPKVIVTGLALLAGGIYLATKK